MPPVPKKLKSWKGHKPLKEGERDIVSKVYNFMKKEANENYAEKLTDARWRTAAACGISEKTVSRILKEMREKNGIQLNTTPKTKQEIVMEKRPKIIIDNDAGGDDAMAIFLALLYEKHFNGPQLVALTTANGNTVEDNVCRNNQRILKVARRQDVPIYRGAKMSIVTTPHAGDYYGKDGLGDTGEELANLVPVQSEGAVTALLELSKKYKDELTVITIGTLTNVALATKMDPGFLDRINHLYVGAGHILGDEHPAAEFNAHMDVEAYHIVAKNATADKVTFLPFSQVQIHLNLSKEWREQVLGSIDTDIIKAQNLYEQVSMKVNERWQALDPAVIACVVKPDLVEQYKYSKHDIIMCGDKRGITSNVFCDKKDANARVIYSIKHEEYKKFLLDVFNADKRNA